MMASTATCAQEAVPLPSLEAEFSNLAYAVIIQDDDEIFKTVYNRSWASDVVEIGNSIVYNHDGFRDFMIQFRGNVTDRKLVSQSFVAAPSDIDGKEGTVARVSHMTGIQNGKLTNFHAVAVATMSFNEEIGRRMVVRETFAVEAR
ncbi:hypothetical protein N0V93_008497 [Gnomoniopsis smithogilvyi]|uniref:Uncharacterized protein n=1 Tax=Gnomoniopsis smithogilvyi TaxID=1191159 RepID=A0A9W8YLU0_9PEZI|nr:hypothetical protein N0V93_008497 [Gnomoniopsis smithogilvyi]